MGGFEKLGIKATLETEEAIQRATVVIDCTPSGAGLENKERYYLNAKNRRGLPADAVARFHLGNGARLERLNWLADGSENGLAQSYGLMVNYLYDLDHIEKNHEAYAENRQVVAASAVRRLLRNGVPADQLPVPIAG